MLLRIIRRLSCIIARKKFKMCGANVIFDPVSSFFSYETIEMGDNVYIGPGAYISSSNSTIKIGSNVLMGPGVHVYGGNHAFCKVGYLIREQTKDGSVKDLDVTIENDVWIGGRATILTGVTIAEGSIIATGSVVNKSTKPFTIYGGVPARVIGKRFSDAEITEHRKVLEERLLAKQ